MSDDPRFPIGKVTFPKGPLSDEQRKEMIADIERTPGRVRSAIQGLSEAQLETPYRDGGWTVRQVVHHLPDSHMNAYVRFKLALTEDEPVIKPYAEDRWAKLGDGRATPLGVSMDLLDSLHLRWVNLMRSLNAEDWQRSFRHPEYEKAMSLDRNLALYAWHGKHHVAHITELRRRMGW